MNPTIEFLGGAGTVTGSKFLLRMKEGKFLVDCGLFQGLKELRLRNRDPLPIRASDIDAIVLTHAHLDHTGYLPVMVREGFQGKVHCTAPTRDITRVILLDSAKIQEEDAAIANKLGYSKHSPAIPLYRVRDADRALRFLRPAKPNAWNTLAPGARFRLRNAGHILGSSLVEIDSGSFRIAFSGDLGRKRPLLLDPPEKIEKADFVVIEATYGDRTHPSTPPLAELARIVNETIARRGHLIVPAFAVGRTQDLLHLLATLRARRAIPDLPIYLDSPMGIGVTEIFTEHEGWHRLGRAEIARINRSVTMVSDPKQSQAILRLKESAIVIAGSGMITGGRVLEHLIRRLPDPRNTVLLVGYQAPSTRGNLLRSGAKELKIRGKYIPVRARIEEISALSAHADQSELIDWLKGFRSPPLNTFIVHGEPQAADALRVRIQDALGWNVTIPKHGESFPLSKRDTGARPRGLPDPRRGPGRL